jgi:hypothetical protein
MPGRKHRPSGLSSEGSEGGMTEYRSDSPEEAGRRRGCEKLAKAAGWSYRGGYYVHPTRARYRAKDMDGWCDLCGNEAIEWDISLNGEDHMSGGFKSVPEAFAGGFDAALNEIGPLFDDWDRLGNDEKGQIKDMAPLFVAKLEHLKATVDRS